MRGTTKFRIAAMALCMAAQGEAIGAIVGGHNIGIKEAPWQLLYKSGGVCGAAWLGGRWVATAAHCVEGETAANSWVYAGITRFKDATNANRIAVKRIVTNPKNSGISQDLALLELAADVTSPLAKPIRYATPADATAGLTNKGVWCMATGWGKLSPSKGLADSLQMVESTIYSTSNYVIRWAGEGGTEDIGSCQGDSGGPLVVKDGKGGYLLVGISSYITSFCGDPDEPSAYSRVSAIAYFISQYAPQDVVGLAELRPDSKALSFSGPDHFRLASDLRLDLDWVRPSGVVAARSSGWFQAGEHALPRQNLPAGPYLIRLRGPQGDASQRIILSR